MTFEDKNKSINLSHIFLLKMSKHFIYMKD